MTLSLSLIKADIIAAEQAIDYYENHRLKDTKT